MPATTAALALLAICTALNIWGLRELSWLNIVFTSIEVAGLLMVVAAGLLSEVQLPPAPAGTEPAMMAAAALLFFVYLGFEEIANLAEEVRNPARNLPMALFVSMGVTTALYVMVAVALVSISPAVQLASSEAPLRNGHRECLAAGRHSSQRHRAFCHRQYCSDHVYRNLACGILHGSRWGNRERLERC